MEYTRWYDRDSYIKLFMNTLEQLDDNSKIELSSELIQIIIQNNYVDDLDEFIEKINSSYLSLRRRWYDKYETILSAIEMIKHITENVDNNTKIELLTEFFNSMRNYCEEKNKKCT